MQNMIQGESNVKPKDYSQIGVRVDWNITTSTTLAVTTFFATSSKLLHAGDANNL